MTKNYDYYFANYNPFLFYLDIESHIYYVHFSQVLPTYRTQLYCKEHNPERCAFTYRDDVTPRITRIVPSATHYGGEINFYVVPFDYNAGTPTITVFSI